MKTRISIAAILLITSTASFGGGFGDILSGAVNDIAREVVKQAGTAMQQAQRAAPAAYEDEYGEDLYYEWQPHWVNYSGLNSESKQMVGSWKGKEILADGMRNIKFATVYSDPIHKLEPIVLIFNKNSMWCGSGGCALAVITSYGGDDYFQHLGAFGEPNDPGVSFTEGALEMYLHYKGRLVTAHWNQRRGEWVRD